MSKIPEVRKVNGSSDEHHRPLCKSCGNVVVDQFIRHKRVETIVTCFYEYSPFPHAYHCGDYDPLVPKEVHKNSH